MRLRLAGKSGLPLAAKVLFTLWMAVWVPAYWIGNGPANFLWLCDVANFVVALAIWRESALLFSSQAAGVLVVQLGWAIDFFGRLVFGRHPYGGTEYMFDASSPLGLRLLSLFHLATPPLLLWAVRRLGYDPRGWKLQTLLAGIILPLCFLFTEPEKNLNWVFRPFGREQTLVEPAVYLGVLMVAYPLLLFWPTHLLLRRWMSRGASGGSLPPG